MLLQICLWQDIYCKLQQASMFTSSLPSFKKIYKWQSAKQADPYEKNKSPKTDISRPAFSHLHPAFGNKCRSVSRKHFLGTLCQQPAAHLCEKREACQAEDSSHSCAGHILVMKPMNSELARTLRVGAPCSSKESNWCKCSSTALEAKSRECYKHLTQMIQNYCKHTKIKTLSLV